MKIRPFVTVALFVGIFLAVSILLLGVLRQDIFPYVYFIFVLFLLIVMVSAMKEGFGRGELVLIVIMAVLAAFAITFFGINAKSYLDTSSQFSSSQLNNISSTNDYYKSYISYLNDAVSNSSQNSQALQSKINLLNQQITQQQAAIRAQTPPPQIIVITQPPPQQPITTPGGERNDD